MRVAELQTKGGHICPLFQNLIADLMCRWNHRRIGNHTIKKAKMRYSILLIQWNYQKALFFLLIFALSATLILRNFHLTQLEKFHLVNVTLGEENFIERTITGPNNESQDRGRFKEIQTEAFRLCKVSSFELRTGHKLQIGYQCEGKKYEEFGKALKDFAAKSFLANEGRRPFPFPPNTTILFFGNSHTRQMSTTLLCQYFQSVVEFDNKSIGTGRTDYFVARFENNATIISLTNNPIVYSKDWSKMVEDIIHQKLNTLDAIILGKFNDYTESQGTNFLTTVSNIAKNLNLDIDFKNIPPPRLKDVAEVYSGPIFSVSMFAARGKHEHQASLTTMEVLQREKNRTNIHVIDGRKYIKAIGYECGSDLYKSIGECLEMTDETPRLANEMHRCAGNMGGHADLIGWEVVESVFTVLSKN